MVIAVVAGATLVAPAPPCRATLTGTLPVVPGSSVPPGLVPPGIPAGTLLATLFSPYSYTTTAGTSSGTLTTAVYREPTGTLDFYYQAANAGASIDAIGRETDGSFQGFATSVEFRTDGASLAGGAGFVNGSVVPITADSDHGTIGFNFTPPVSSVQPGQTSDVLVISTDATNFQAGLASLIDGGTKTVAAFQPAAVPEPGAAALVMVAGVAGLGLRTRRMR